MGFSCNLYKLAFMFWLLLLYIGILYIEFISYGLLLCLRFSPWNYNQLAILPFLRVYSLQLTIGIDDREKMGFMKPSNWE